MYILGISAMYHNSAAALLQNGVIVAAAEEERFTRIKNDPSFPEHAIRYCLEEAGITLAEVGQVVFYDKPFLKFERLLETYLVYAPKGLRSFLTAIPVWIREKLFLKKLLYTALEKIGGFDRKKTPLLFTEHHLAHAASAFFPSPFGEAAILTLDGIGEWATATICRGAGNSIRVLRELHFPHSAGLLYSAFTYYLGFRVNEGEYKLMGLAPYGRSGSEEVERYRQLIRSRLCTIYGDGSLFLHMEYFRFHTGLRMTDDRKWAHLFGFPRRLPEAPLEQHHCDLALAIQEVTEELLLGLARTARELTGANTLCLAGGVALNSVANGKLQASGLFRELYIQPAAGDSGGALGAALAAHFIGNGAERMPEEGRSDGMRGAFLGPAYDEGFTLRSLKKYKPAYTRLETEEELVRTVARLLSEGRIVGWHQGRLEFGPRSLGARSILADPRSQEMQRTLNLKIKFRESFRPFAPAVLAEEAAEYFELPGASPYMLLVRKVRPEKRFPYPPDFGQRPMDEKLKCPKSELSAATHLDYSARIQTVHRETNERFWRLLRAFRELTGCPALVNTSFNVRDEPIVNTPEEAYRCFMKTEMDYLVIGSLLFWKEGAGPVSGEDLSLSKERHELRP
ncbi:MAG TPA: carbamoyltransferase [Chitinophagaceae bacterium]|jgi:carbamoyltransferase|nr:carbamoyltransferase [Chitinophagaceae bacterium]